MDMFFTQRKLEGRIRELENTVTGTSEILNRFWQKKTKAAW